MFTRVRVMNPKKWSLLKICILPLLCSLAGVLQLYQGRIENWPLIGIMWQACICADKKNPLKSGEIERQREFSKSENESHAGKGVIFCCQHSLTLMGETWSYLEHSMKKNFSICAWQKFSLNLTVVNKNKPRRQKMSEKQENAFQAICQCGRSKTSYCTQALAYH